MSVSRVQLETEKNRLEMLLNNNLLKKLEQLQQELQEMKGEDRKQKLDMLESELKSVGDRLSFIYSQFSGTLHTLLLLLWLLLLFPQPTKLGRLDIWRCLCMCELDYCKSNQQTSLKLFSTSFTITQCGNLGDFLGFLVQPAAETRQMTDGDEGMNPLHLGAVWQTSGSVWKSEFESPITFGWGWGQNFIKYTALQKY